MAMYINTKIISSKLTLFPLLAQNRETNIYICLIINMVWCERGTNSITHSKENLAFFFSMKYEQLGNLCEIYKGRLTETKDILYIYIYFSKPF